MAKLDRLDRSVRDAHEIADELAEREVKLNIGGSIHDPTDPTGKLLFSALAMIAEFEAGLINLRHVGECSNHELAEQFSAGRSTIYRAIARAEQEAIVTPGVE